MTARDGTFEVTAPSADLAHGLARTLATCDCQVVQAAACEWVVRARPRAHDGRSLADALSAVEAWLASHGVDETRVTIDGRAHRLQPVVT